MSLALASILNVPPEHTAAIAHATFPTGNRYMQKCRDSLGTVQSGGTPGGGIKSI